MAKEKTIMGLAEKCNEVKENAIKRFAYIRVVATGEIGIICDYSHAGPFRYLVRMENRDIRFLGAECVEEICEA